ncbi:TonB C-terminal domain-containing protein [Acinetobacter bereziniae]|uniref:TonB C-terminal domain-containing protein n=1 Tax=Acinetobacter bereziniae TaxID=106648 RepID=UPI001250B838|nr:TonB C-terminal domain-containing protein [Acinetobacter bereziniae]
MQYKTLLISSFLICFSTFSFAEKNQINPPIEVNRQQIPSNPFTHEMPPTAPPQQKITPTQNEQLRQNQITSQIYKSRMNRITKYWKRPATDLAEKANVRVYLDEQGNVEDILFVGGQFSDEFALSIKTAIYKAAPFEMPNEQSLKKQFQEILLHFAVSE